LLAAALLTTPLARGDAIATPPSRRAAAAFPARWLRWIGDKDGAPIGLLWSNSLVFHGDDVLVTNLSLDVAAVTSSSLRTVDGPWADQVKLHTVSKIKKRLPKVSE
jgi:hypothetical protein